MCPTALPSTRVASWRVELQSQPSDASCAASTTLDTNIFIARITLAWSWHLIEDVQNPSPCSCVVEGQLLTVLRGIAFSAIGGYLQSGMPRMAHRGGGKQHPRRLAVARTKASKALCYPDPKKHGQQAKLRDLIFWCDRRAQAKGGSPTNQIKSHKDLRKQIQGKDEVTRSSDPKKQAQQAKARELILWCDPQAQAKGEIPRRRTSESRSRARTK